MIVRSIGYGVLVAGVYYLIDAIVGPVSTGYPGIAIIAGFGFGWGWYMRSQT